MTKLSFNLVLVIGLASLALLPPFDVRAHGWGARMACAVVALTAALGLARTALSRTEWTRADVERAMGMCLRRLLAFTAALAALAWNPPARDALIVAALILSGYAVSAGLRRVFPPS